MKAHPKKTRIVDPKTIGGGFELKDLFPLPTPVWIIIRTTQAAFRYRLLTLFLLTLPYSLITQTNLLRNLAVVTMAVAILLIVWIVLHYEHDPTPSRILAAIRRRWIIRHRWPKALQYLGIREPPILRKIRYTPNGITGWCYTDQGVTSTDLANHNEEIASILRAYEVKVNNSIPHYAYVSIIWGDPTSRILYPEDIKQAKPDSLTTITFGLDPDHSPVNLSLTTSILIVGESEAGKSNCLWSILNALNEKVIPYRLWVIDPAGGVELSELENSPFLQKYAQRFTDIESLIQEANNAMEARLATLKAQSLRKSPVSDDYPINIIVVDELLTLPNYDHRSPLGQILSAGRKAGFIVIALSQLSQIDALGRTRDLFPQRLCHATKSREMTDAALGSGAELAGAYCSRIPKNTPGVGYYFSLDSRIYTRFRTPLITDRNTKIISKGTQIQTPFTPTRKKRSILDRSTAVYQFYGDYDGELGRLLYVGIAFDPAQRQKQHAQQKVWWKDVDTDLTEIEWYSTRSQAKQRETELIRSEDPVYNKQERNY